MSAEPRQTTDAEAWTRWQDQVVQGRFVLRRCLGWSNHDAVFLTEHKAKNLAEAAIKFVRADAPHAQPLLAQWQTALTLSHPHLVQLFEIGRWQAEGQDYLYVVMEYGDQTLAEILGRRPLSAEEVQELLPPVLEALTFLHRRQLVHSSLKPSNFLAVGEQLKLSSDTIRPAGQDYASTAGDVWNFGATLVEALTARPRFSSDQPFDAAALPAGLPASLVETVRRCLSPVPADRPSVIELRAENKPGASQAAAKAEPAAPVSRAETTSQAASRVAVSYPPAPNASRADSSQSVPGTPREVPPLEVVQTASRVAVSFYSVPSTPREPAAPPPANTASRVAAPAQPSPSAPRESAPPQAATAAPRVAAPAQPVPSTSREIALAQLASVAPRVAALSQPAQGASHAAVPPATSKPREVVPPPAANAASRMADPVQPAPSTSREVASSQPASMAPRVASPPHPQAASHAAVTVPPATNTPREATPPQAAKVAPREVAPPQSANAAPRMVPPAQPVPSNPQGGAPAQPASRAADSVPAEPSIYRPANWSKSATTVPGETPAAQPASIASQVAALSQPIASAPREVRPSPPAGGRSRAAVYDAPSVLSAPRAAAASQPATITPPEVTPPRAPLTVSREAPWSPPAPSQSQEAVPSESAPKRHILGIALGALLLATAVWIGLRSTEDSPAPPQPAVVHTPAPVAPSAPAKVVASKPPVSTPVAQPEEPLAPSPPSSSSVLNEVLPTVPEKIQNKIQGRVYVTVRVLVDPAGNVNGVLMDSAGPSKYFARLSEQAARQWEFEPADIEDARVWLLRFEYTRNGVSVRTTEQ